MKTHCFLRSASAIVMAVTAAGGAAAQDRHPDLVLQGEFTTVPAPEIVKFQEFDSPPTPPPGFMERFHAWHASLDKNRPAPPAGDTKPAGPPPGSESSLSTTRGSTDFTKLANVALFPSSSSPINEMSMDVGTRFVFAAGNWWAARSHRGGKNGSWVYIDPWADMPDFCCDQYVAYDPGRDMFIWYRQGSSDNVPNNIRIGASLDNGVTWCFYNITSNTLGLGDKFLDYPHIGLTNDHVYFTTNVYDAGVKESMILHKWELDDLAACRFANITSWTTTGLTWCPCEEGCTEEMYLGSHEDQDTFRIWAQNEGNSTLSLFRTDIASWTSFGSGDANCPDPNGVNPCGRTDSRVKTGVVHSSDGENPIDGQQSTTKRVTFMWNVAEGNGFPFPYAEAATFELGTYNYLNRPLVWNKGGAFTYPSLGVNKRGHLGMSLFFMGPDDFVQHIAGIDDDINGEPPSWELHLVRPSTKSPSRDAWGDFGQCRGLYPSELGWAASGWTVKGSGIVPHYVVFCRERDEDGIRKTWRKGGN